MKVSAFIRSYVGDKQWLEYCLKSIVKYGDPFWELVICVPVHDLDEMTRLVNGFKFDHSRIVGVGEYCKTGYVQQQADKLCADQMTSGDYIMFFDSDCILTGPIDLPDFFVGERPKLLFSPWHDVGTAHFWNHVTKQVLKSEPFFETMRAHPSTWHRRTLSQFRNRMENIHGKPFVEYMATLDQFSEFNALGNFAHQHAPEDYTWVRAGENDGYPRPFRQFWSKREDFPKDELDTMVRI